MGGKPKRAVVNLPKVLYVTIEEMDDQTWSIAAKTRDIVGRLRAANARGQRILIALRSRRQHSRPSYQAEFHPQPGKRGRRG